MFILIVLLLIAIIAIGSLVVAAFVILELAFMGDLFRSAFRTRRVSRPSSLKHWHPENAQNGTPDRVGRSNTQGRAGHTRAGQGRGGQRQPNQSRTEALHPDRAFSSAFRTRVRSAFGVCVGIRAPGLHYYCRGCKAHQSLSRQLGWSGIEQPLNLS